MANNHINRGTDHCVPPGGQPALASLQLYLESYFLLSTLIKSFVTVSDHYCTSYPLTNQKFHPWLRAGRTKTRYYQTTIEMISGYQQHIIKTFLKTHRKKN